MMSKIKNIIVAVLLVFSVGFNYYDSLKAQIIWGASGNYSVLKDNPRYRFCYKIESEYKPTQVFYEMTDFDEFGNEIIFENVDYDNRPVSMGTLRINIDSSDTVVFTDLAGIVKVSLSKCPQSVGVKIFPKPEGFHLPISNGVIPTRVRIVWGSNVGRAILTLYSKSKLNDDELDAINKGLFSGKPAESDKYYYYFSEE